MNFGSFFGISVIQFLVIYFAALVFCAGLDQVDDTDLIHLLTGEKNVVVLFTKDNCAACLELENMLENIQTDIEDNVKAVVVKSHNSHMVTIYDPQGEPSLIYFRKGIPLLYYGKHSEENILQMFIDNQEPIVKELSDSNFEHLTQAATGATTGDWFVFFYSADCVLCQRLYAIWESVGAKLKRYANVARVNRLGPGIFTAKRFGITSSPEFIFLRQGKVYRYKLKEYTPKSFLEFAEGGYRNQKHPVNVPAVKSSFDEFVEQHFASILQDQNIVIWGGAVVIVLILISCLKFSSASKKQKSSGKKEKSK